MAALLEAWARQSKPHKEPRDVTLDFLDGPFDPGTGLPDGVEVCDPCLAASKLDEPTTVGACLATTIDGFVTFAVFQDKASYQAASGRGVKPRTREAILAALQAWTAMQGMSWDEDHNLPEPTCDSCGTPINVWDGEDACQDCGDCESCCWDNHAGEPHVEAPATRPRDILDAKAGLEQLQHALDADGSQGLHAALTEMALEQVVPDRHTMAFLAQRAPGTVILGTNKDDQLQAKLLPIGALADEWAEDEGGFEAWTARSVAEARTYAALILRLTGGP